MSEEQLSIGASLDEIKSRISEVQNKGLDLHPNEFEEIYKELNRSLNEIDGL